MNKTILQKDKSYTFTDYFELNYSTADIVAEFGYQYALTRLALPRMSAAATTDRLKDVFYKKLPHVSLTSETARREMLVAPILLELLDYLDLKIDIEYPIYVNEQLKGSIDYLVRSTHQVIVVEAKKADLEKGFTQLAVELIAMDHYLETGNTHLYGAVTVGDVWRFGVLMRQQKTIHKDIDSFRVPSDLDDLFKVFIGILSPVAGNQ